MAMESLASLLEAIVEDSSRSDCHSSMAQQSGETEEILLDIELDRARYLLIRLPKSEERAQLSPREQEIVRMVAGGLPNKTIASVLSISPWTVCTYLRRIFVKLGVNSRAAMVARMELGWMQKRGLMDLSSQSSASDTMSPVPNLLASNLPGQPPTTVSPGRSLPNRHRPQKNTGKPLK